MVERVITAKGRNLGGKEGMGGSYAGIGRVSRHGEPQVPNPMVWS